MSHLGIIAALRYLNSSEIRGGKLILDKPGDYWIGNSIDPGFLLYDIEIEFTPGAWLRVVDNLTSPVFRFKDMTLSRTISIFEPQIDCSRGLTSGASQGCSGIETTGFYRVTTWGGHLYGGTTPSNGKSDSGHTPVANIFTQINGGIIEGFGDNGVYATGDNQTGTAGDGYSCEINNVHRYGPSLQ